MSSSLDNHDPSGTEAGFASLRPGDRLGRYELLLPIARGGMAQVWAGQLQGQRGFQKLVALKTILPEFAVDPEFERMFLDEARIAAGIHHPNVCEIYELGEDRGALYMAMEWMDGDSLAQLIGASGKSAALDPRVAVRIVSDATAGVQAAHELASDDGVPLRVVHRDLSPHNILISAAGITKVTDFGVAKAVGQAHEKTGVGQIKGKLSYMSPEQVEGKPIACQSDIFTLGCVLYEATTGVRPFSGESEVGVIKALMNGTYPAPSTLVKDYPPALERIIARALASNPVQRYPSAELLRIALEEYLADGPLVTHSLVAHVLRARLGAKLSERNDRIRKIARARPSTATPSPGHSFAPASIPPPPSNDAQIQNARTPLPPGTEARGDERSRTVLVPADQASRSIGLYVAAALVGALLAALTLSAVFAAMRRPSPTTTTALVDTATVTLPVATDRPAAAPPPSAGEEAVVTLPPVARTSDHAVTAPAAPEGDGAAAPARSSPAPKVARPDLRKNTPKAPEPGAVPENPF